MTLPTIDMQAMRAYPPRVSEYTKTFWDALGAGRWTTSWCKACGRSTFPPKPVCPHCWSPDVQWSELSTRGTLYSWTRVHAAPAAFGAEAPYAVGIVDLSDGVRLACRLVEDGARALRIGQAVDMVVLRYQDGPLFAARPAD